MRFEDVGFDEGEMPENPYINVKDVSELPMKGSSARFENVEEETQRISPLYNFRAPAQKSGKVNEIVDKILESELLVKAIDLTSVSKPIREELKFRVTQQRVSPGEQPKPTQIKSQFEEVEVKNDRIKIESLPSITWDKTIKTEVANNGEKLSAFVVGDVVMQYLETLLPGETPKEVIVAKDSTSLRSVYPLVNARLHVESLVDSGSQIVSVSQNTAEKAGLVWDPDIVIYMQSANKGLERSLGLAKNVPFLFGDMTVLLQVHIIKEPAYDLLLGRPFDTLLRTNVQNFEDGRQNITLSDPVTKRRLTIPTFARGTASTIQSLPRKEKDELKEDSSEIVQQGFLITSRN
ncbi:hypothetical protein D9757_015266 [Collybiopsis confluens]|uniref:Peptidase A2 domain-containing protein n=1 Tax=Collybiopsis confluens TaxID=2823264 RepID=A0A8H5CM06_9AGAR|nr:hypothetical protein D9757_015266 [Collybiopsis confluens]